MTVKTIVNKMATGRLCEITNKEISEIKINSVPKRHKRRESTKTIIRLLFGEYSPR
jgi:hypothetical protein